METHEDNLQATVAEGKAIGARLRDTEFEVAELRHFVRQLQALQSKPLAQVERTENAAPISTQAGCRTMEASEACSLKRELRNEICGGELGSTPATLIAS